MIEQGKPGSMDKNRTEEQKMRNKERRTHRDLSTLILKIKPDLQTQMGDLFSNCKASKQNQICRRKWEIYSPTTRP
jgi:hypothetical protein